MSDMLGAGAGGNIGLAAYIVAVIDIGIDFGPIADGEFPDVFLYDHDDDFHPESGETVEGTHIEVGAKIIGSNLELGFAVGPIEIGVMGGTATLDADANPATEDYATLTVELGGTGADGRYWLFGENAESLMDNLSYDLRGVFDVTLPIYLGSIHLTPDLAIKTNPANGDQGFQELLNWIIDGHTSNGLEPIVFEYPDIQGMFDGDFSLLGILNNPGLILDAVDFALGGVQDIFGSSIASDLPVIGEKLAHAATFIRDFRQGFLGELREKLGTPGKAIEIIRQAMFDVFGPSELNILKDGDDPGTDVTIEDIEVAWYDADGHWLKDWVLGDDPAHIDPDGPETDVEADAIQFNMELGGTIFSTGIDIPVDFDIPGVGLQVDGGFGVAMAWSFDFGLGVSLDDGFYLTTNASDDPEVEVEISAFLDGTPLDPEHPTPFSVTGKLLFLELTGTDLGREEVEPGDYASSGVYGGLYLDLEGDDAGRLTLDHILSSPLDEVFNPDLAVEVEINLELELGLSFISGLPRLHAEFYMDWGWSLMDGASDLMIELRNVGIELGSIIGDFLQPIAEKIESILGPFEPIIDVLTTEIPNLDKLLDDPNLMGIINLILNVLGYDPIDWSFVYAVDTLLDITGTIAGMDSDGLIVLGDVTGLGTGNVEWESAFDNDTSGIRDAFESVGESGLFDSFQGLSDTENASADEFEFEFMGYIFDIGNWAKLLTGGDATLFTLDLPLLEFEINFNEELCSIGPFMGFYIVLNARGSISGYADLAFGYDTYGIRRAIETGDWWQVFDGFYVADWTLPTFEGSGLSRHQVDPGGKEKNELGFVFEIGLEAGLSIAKIITAGVGGRLRFEVGFDLADIEMPEIQRDDDGNITGQTWTGDGKVRISEMITMWNYDGPGAYTEFPLMNLININSKLSLIFNFFVDVGFSIFKFRLIDYDFPEIVLGEWNFEAPHVQPILGSMDGSTLTLHTGSRAADREYFLSENYYESGNPADADGAEN